MTFFALFLSAFAGFLEVDTGDFLLELVHEDGREDTDNAEDDEYPGHGRLEENAYVAAADAERAAQTLFADGSEDESKDNGRGVQVELTHEVADKAEDQHDDNVREVLVDGVGADDTQDGDTGDEYRVGKAGYLSEAAAAQRTQSQHKELDKDEAREEGVGHARVLSEEFGSRSKTLDYKTAHENCRNRLTGDTQSQHGDE